MPSESAGGGSQVESGSDLTPALRLLADEPGVEAVVVLTDGEVRYPASPPPFPVLSILADGRPEADFRPPYGTVISLTAEE